MLFGLKQQKVKVPNRQEEKKIMLVLKSNNSVRSAKNID
jgi:hypothetical protein